MVLKEQIPVTAVTTTLVLPKPFRVVHVGFQGDPGTVVVWALCDEERPSMVRTFCVTATGEDIDTQEDRAGGRNWQYVGTAQTPGIPVVWHVFEDRETP